MFVSKSQLLMNKLIIGYIALYLSILAWFGIVVVAKLVSLDYYKPIFSRSIGAIINSMWLIPFFIHRKFFQEKIPSITNRYLVKTFTIGVIHMCHGLLYIASIAYFSGSAHTAIHMGAPLFIFAINLIFRFEKFNIQRCLSVAILCGGISLIVTASFLNPDVSVEKNNRSMVMGCILILTSVAFLAFYATAVSISQRDDNKIAEEHKQHTGEDLPKENPYFDSMKLLGFTGLFTTPICILLVAGAHFTEIEIFQTPTIVQFFLIAFQCSLSSIYFFSFVVALCYINPLMVSMSQPLVLPLCAIFVFLNTGKSDSILAYSGMGVIGLAVILLALVDRKEALTTASKNKLDSEVELEHALMSATKDKDTIVAL